MRLASIRDEFIARSIRAPHTAFRITKLGMDLRQVGEQAVDDLGGGLFWHGELTRWNALLMLKIAADQGATVDRGYAKAAAFRLASEPCTFDPIDHREADTLGGSSLPSSQADQRRRDPDVTTAPTKPS